MHSVTTLAVLASALVSALRANAVPVGPPSGQNCSNFDYSQPFHIVAQGAFSDVPRRFVFPLNWFGNKNPKGPAHLYANVNRTGPNVNFTFAQGHLDFFAPHGVAPGNAPEYLYSENPHKGEFTFTPRQDLPPGTLGLTNAFVYGQGNTGCAVTVGGSTGAFTMCGPDNGTPFIYYKRYGDDCNPVELVGLLKIPPQYPGGPPSGEQE